MVFYLIIVGIPCLTALGVVHRICVAAERCDKDRMHHEWEMARLDQEREQLFLASRDAR